MNHKIPEYISVPGAAIGDLIRLGDGDAALLFLYLTATGGEKTSAEASGDLNWSSERTRTALDKLISIALVPSASGGARSPAAEPKDAVSAVAPAQRRDVNGEAEKGRQFYPLVQEVQRIFGHVLSADELARLFGIYDSLGLPPEVILQLVGYCIAETGGRDATGRPPSMKYIEKAAYTWEREGIFTLEQAEQYIKERAEKHRESARIKKALSIFDRDFTPSEKKYVDSWLALGFDAEAVAIAYDRTITNTGRLAWNYINSIINSWHGKGLYKAADIMEKDRRPERGFAQNPFGRPAGAVQPDGRELERINRILESMDGESSDVN